MRISQQDADRMIARLASVKPSNTDPSKPSKIYLYESELHDDVIAECERRGWLAIRSRMDKRATNQKGTTDFIIAASWGVVFWIECKIGKNTVSDDQTAMLNRLSTLNQRFAVIRSLDEFLAFLKLHSYPHKL